jgi:hypothetical protein
MRRTSTSGRVDGTCVGTPRRVLRAGARTGRIDGRLRRTAVRRRAIPGPAAHSAALASGWRAAAISWPSENHAAHPRTLAPRWHNQRDVAGRNGLRRDHAERNCARGLQSVVDKQVFDLPFRTCAPCRCVP